MGDLSTCGPRIIVLTVRIFQTVLLSFISLNFQICIPQPLQIRIPPSSTISKT